MREVNMMTQQGQRFLYEWQNCCKGHTIEGVYVNPSSYKRNTFNDIWFRAKNTEGYNNDLKITGSNCYIFSTMYTFTNEEGTFLVKATKSHTYIMQIA